MGDHKVLHIVELRTENVKRIKAVRVVPDPDKATVVVAGRNGAGKTSVLDAIMFALGGKAAQKGTPNPVRSTATEAYVELDLGDYTVRRTWKGDQSSVTITAKDGANYGSPQKFLDKRIGDLSFDPLEFARAAPAIQRDELLSMVELPFDPDELDARRLGLYEQRTQVGRDLKQAEAEAKQYPVPDPGLPDRPVSVAAVAETLAEAQDATREYAKAEERVVLAERALKDAVDEMTAARIALGLAAPPSSPENIESLRSQIANAETTNEAIRARDAREAAIARQDRLSAQVTALTDDMAAVDARKAQGLAAAKMPIHGLGFDADGVTYKGQPFSQASAAEQLRVSVAIGMAAHPEIRVMRITDGSLLDSHNMAVIEELATEHEYQVWIERVDESGAVGVVIEDGEVAGAEPWPEPELSETETAAPETVCGHTETDPLDATTWHVCERPPHPPTEAHDMTGTIREG